MVENILGSNNATVNIGTPFCNGAVFIISGLAMAKRINLLHLYVRSVGNSMRTILRLENLTSINLEFIF